MSKHINEIIQEVKRLSHDLQEMSNNDYENVDYVSELATLKRELDSLRDVALIYQNEIALMLMEEKWYDKLKRCNSRCW